MARYGTYRTKQNMVEDCRRWPMHISGQLSAMFNSKGVFIRKGLVA